MESTQQKSAEMTPEEQNTQTSENALAEQETTPGTETGEELEKLKRELDEMREKYVRLVADFDNQRKRNAREKIEIIQTAGRDVIGTLLDVLDDCDRAEKQMQQSEDSAQLKEGVQLIFNKLRNVLQAHGLKAMECVHQDFDVEKHEAITEMPAPEDGLRNKVLDEVQKGYLLNDKIIRFAKVVVGK